MALGDPYATLADLRDWQGVPAGTHTADDAKRTMALAAATKEINRITGRQFNAATVATSRTFAPGTMRECEVDDFYSTAGLIVQTDPGGTGVYSQTWNAATDYELFPLNGLVDGEPWPYNKLRACGGMYFPKYVETPYRHVAVVQITALWGWATVPEPIHESCLIIAAETFKMKDTPFGIAGMTQFGTAVRWRKTGMAEGKLQPYVLDPVLAG